LKLSFGLIGPIQLSAILTAAENNLRGRVLTSPSVTTVNGIRSNVFVGDQSAYISDYEVVSSNLDPTISVLTTGTSLDVKPFVSADRKYVTLDFQPATSSVKYFTDYISAPRVITAGNNGGGGGVVTPAVNYPIELPNVTVKEASTTLTIPDRGSVLIGGFGTSGRPADLLAGVFELGVKDLTLVANNSTTGSDVIAELMRANRVRKLVCSFPRGLTAIRSLMNSIAPEKSNLNSCRKAPWLSGYVQEPRALVVSLREPLPAPSWPAAKRHASSMDKNTCLKNHCSVTSH
jgi:hypothetical protein